MRTIFAGAAAALALATATSALAGNNLAEAIQRLHLSAQQLLSLRDFLGPFSRGTDLDATGASMFILRDSATMAYLGEFTIRVDAGGAVEIEKISGPATLDASRALEPSLRLDRKDRARLVSALAGSQALPPAAPISTEAPAAPASAATAGQLPQQWLSAAKLIDPAAAGTILQSKGVFFRDGSGYTRSLRVQASSAAGTPPALHLEDRYYSPLKSNGAQVWRDTIAEMSIDASVVFGDFEQRYGCASAAGCKPAGGPLTPGSKHLIAWSHQLVASVPPQLLAQIVAPVSTAASAAPDSAEAAESAPSAPDAASPPTPPQSGEGESGNPHM